jgi:hypothetical protein
MTYAALEAPRCTSSLPLHFASAASQDPGEVDLGEQYRWLESSQSSSQPSLAQVSLWSAVWLRAAGILELNDVRLSLPFSTGGERPLTCLFCLEFLASMPEYGANILLVLLWSNGGEA